MFKKVFIGIIVFLLVIMCFTAVFANDELEILPNEKYEIGDANTDNTVNVKDATSIQKHIAGLEILNSLQLNLADVNAARSFPLQTKKQLSLWKNFQRSIIFP